MNDDGGSSGGVTVGPVGSTDDRMLRLVWSSNLFPSLSSVGRCDGSMGLADLVDIRRAM